MNLFHGCSWEIGLVPGRIIMLLFVCTCIMMRRIKLVCCRCRRRRRTAAAGRCQVEPEISAKLSLKTSPQSSPTSVQSFCDYKVHSHRMRRRTVPRDVWRRTSTHQMGRRIGLRVALAFHYGAAVR